MQFLCNSEIAICIKLSWRTSSVYCLSCLSAHSNPSGKGNAQDGFTECLGLCCKETPTLTGALGVCRLWTTGAWSCKSCRLWDLLQSNMACQTKVSLGLDQHLDCVLSLTEPGTIWELSSMHLHQHSNRLLPNACLPVWHRWGFYDCFCAIWEVGLGIKCMKGLAFGTELYHLWWLVAHLNIFFSCF